jgi:hypothetical protein
MLMGRARVGEGVKMQLDGLGIGDLGRPPWLRVRLVFSLTPLRFSLAELSETQCPARMESRASRLAAVLAALPCKLSEFRLAQWWSLT